MTPLSVNCVDHSEVIEQLLTWARCRDCTGGDYGIRDRVVTDYLREHIKLLATTHSTDGTVRPVHIQRFSSSAKRQLRLLSTWFSDADVSLPSSKHGANCGTPLRRVYERCVEILVLLGEIVHCGGGYYLPTPLRSVSLREGQSILIGGISTQAIYRQWNYRVEWAGFARHTSRDGHPPYEIPRQSLSRWLGISQATLADWTAEQLATAHHVLKGIGSATDTLQFDVYHSKLGGLQAQKWIAASRWTKRNVSPTELWLCRSQARPRLFWLAPLSHTSQGLRFLKSADVTHQQARRLVYGLDDKHGNPSTVDVKLAEDRRTRLLTLRNRPTDDVLMLLTALGYQHDPGTAEGPHWPLPMHFEVADLWWPDVSTALSAIGIVLNVENSRR